MTNSKPESPPFWKLKPLEEMTSAEWESLCDGCARCCLVKLEDEDTGDIHFTDVGCTLLDVKTCRCRRTRRPTDGKILRPGLTWRRAAAPQDRARERPP